MRTISVCFLALCLAARAEVLPPRPATQAEVNAGTDKIHPVTPYTAAGAGGFGGGGSNPNAVTNGDLRNIHIVGTSTNLGGVILPQGVPGDTNAAWSGTNVTQYFKTNTLDVSNLGGTSTTNLLAIGTASNAVPVALGTGLQLVGGATPTLNATGGGGVSGMVVSNYFVTDTNLFVWDVAKVQKLGLRFETNMTTLQISNAWNLTNREAELSTWEDTNGVWKISNVAVLGGLALTNGNGLWRGTNASQDDEAVLRLDGRGTNVCFAWNTNWQPPLSFTNSLSGGGGGGGGNWTLIAHSSATGTSGDTTSATLNSTGANLLVAVVVGTGLTPATIIDSKSNSGWLAATNWAFSKISLFYNLSPASVGASHTVTSQTASGCNVQFFAFAKSGGSPAFDAFSSGNSTGNWGASSLQSGSLTPATANDLFVSAAWFDTSSTMTVDSSFNLLESPLFNGGSAIGSAAAYKFKVSDSAAENPGWHHLLGDNADGYTVQASWQ